MERHDTNSGSVRKVSDEQMLPEDSEEIVALIEEAISNLQQISDLYIGLQDAVAAAYEARKRRETQRPNNE